MNPLEYAPPLSEHLVKKMAQDCGSAGAISQQEYPDPSWDRPPILTPIPGGNHNEPTNLNANHN